MDLFFAAGGLSQPELRRPAAHLSEPKCFIFYWFSNDLSDSGRLARTLPQALGSPRRGWPEARVDFFSGRGGKRIHPRSARPGWLAEGARVDFSLAPAAGPERGWIFFRPAK